MSRLDRAADRFQDALEHLENSAADNRRSSARMAELEAERERLLARIAALEEDMAALTGIAEEVEQRLDGAIVEFRTALAR
jgi:cell division protein FtsB